MSKDTRAVLAAAVDAHGLARADPDADDVGTRLAAEDAARAHLAAVDPGYAERTAGLEPHQRIVAPDLKAAYDEALAAHHAAPGDPEKAAEASRLGDEYAAARTAARVAEGRWDMAVHTPGGEG